MADANGYTALYEKRAGNTTPGCNIDVATMTTAACDVNITTSDTEAQIESKLNGAGTVFCVAKGDYTGKGLINVTASGSSGTRKVLRYYDAADINDEPWNQSGANQASFEDILITGNYWIVHRIRLVGGSLGYGADNGTGNFHILNRCLLEDGPGFLLDNHGGSDVTLQNSVVRHTTLDGLADRPGVGTGSAVNFHVVNNEIYDVQGDAVIFQTTGDNPFAGGVVENNDMYITSAYQTGGGTTALAENAVDIKGGGSAASPLRVIHNRCWGWRFTSSSSGGLGSYGECIIFHTSSGGSNHYGIVKDNILFDGSIAISVPNYSPDHWSIFGNLIYKMQGVPTGTTRAISLESSTNVDVYLNTAIQTTNGNSAGWLSYGKNQTEDIRGNVAIDSGTIEAWGSGTATQIDYNVYYNSTNGGETNKIDKTITTRANSTLYAVGTIIRTIATPPADGTAGDFLYIVTTQGTTAGSLPTYPVILGDDVTDGSCVLKAIRGPYSFRKKLRTVSGGELTYIPYAKPYNASPLPEYNYCPSGAESNAIGSRTSIGIDDTKPPVAPFDVDLSGVSR
jgi:hypothetical protein